MTRTLIVLGVVLVLGVPAATAQTLSSSGGTARCCQSDKGPEPVAYSGRWLDGMFTRDACVSKKYGFWDADTPNEARTVCARRKDCPPPCPPDPVPPPPEDGHH